ncbi:family 47 glycoside hydrolase [Xylariaceae sp. FL0804]|nr:family 47 glycoside hydrolase [Xylariaceae sp. FL0804]
MALLRRRILLPLILATVLVLAYRYCISGLDEWRQGRDYFWRKIPTRYPVQSIRPLPTGPPLAFPKVQHEFRERESAQARAIRLRRQTKVRDEFRRCWEAYRDYAWLQDELSPITDGSKNTFGGWAATLVDSLDTLWIMDMHDEFERAVNATIAIDFTRSSLSQVNVFETTIRYLGGFLAAYDLSGDKRLLYKAREVGEMLYVAFDTPNRMPITRWDFDNAARGGKQEADEYSVIAEVGSLCMEFTRLSFLTGDPKWFDATERITEVLSAQQNMTKLPGMWPLTVRPKYLQFSDDNTFGLGAMADSAFEYLPKMSALTGGRLPVYEDMYKYAMDTAKKHNLYRPMTPDNADILVAGTVHVSGAGLGPKQQQAEGQQRVLQLEHAGTHLACFAGGMFALGARLFSRPDDLDVARRLTRGCVWASESMPYGIMPETFGMAPCPPLTTGSGSGSGPGSQPQQQQPCRWDEQRWKRAVMERAGRDGVGGRGPWLDDALAEKVVAERRLPRGFTEIGDARYQLRPEAIESVFVLHRITGDERWRARAWDLFDAVQKATRTRRANAALADVTAATAAAGPAGMKGSGLPRERLPRPPLTDAMESFWMGETLKYFYLVFSDPDLVSLDEYVFNTEAHPLKRWLP